MTINGSELQTMKKSDTMRTIILYSTKSGGARDYAEMLASLISDSKVYDLDKKVPDLKDFDLVIAGSGIRMGKAYKPFRSFLKDNSKVLLTKKTAFFLCGMTLDKEQENFEKNIPGELRKAAVCVSMFAGKQPIGKPPDQNWMSVDRMNDFAHTVNENNDL
jgi:menaquinone-dependent protoporphyrinogen oxidase